MSKKRSARPPGGFFLLLHAVYTDSVRLIIRFMFGFGRKKESPQARRESESKRETSRPNQERAYSVEDETKKQEQEFRSAAARLEMSIEDTANALSGGI